MGVIALRDRPYRLLTRLHQGDQGHVFLARPLDLNRRVIIKIIQPRNELEIRNFRREVQALALLNHPHNVTIIDAGEEQTEQGTRLFIITEYIHGLSLADLLKSEGALGLERSLNLCRQLLMGLAEAHSQGIMHRDIKPANIMVSDHACLHDHVRLIDYGLARLDSEENQTGTDIKSISGTATYMPPEIIQGHTPTTASDIYSVGIVLFECLAGRPPFGADSFLDMVHHHIHTPPPPIERFTRVPAGLSRILQRAMAKDPAQRFENAQALYNTLEALDQRLPLSRATARPGEQTLGPGSDPTLQPEAPARAMIWVLEGDSAINKEVLDNLSAMDDVLLRNLDSRERKDVYGQLRTGRLAPPALVVFGQRHVLTRDALLNHLGSQGISGRLLICSSLSADLLQGAINFCGVDHSLAVPIARRSLQAAAHRLVERHRNALVTSTQEQQRTLNNQTYPHEPPASGNHPIAPASPQPYRRPAADQAPFIALNTTQLHPPAPIQPRRQRPAEAPIKPSEPDNLPPAPDAKNPGDAEGDEQP